MSGQPDDQINDQMTRRPDDQLHARERMIAEQLAGRGIRDARVLDAMQRVPRHLFVPPDQQPFAYTDRALPIGGDQTISQPFMVATMTEALGAEPSALVLEVGTGSGYQAAVLSLLVTAGAPRVPPALPAQLRDGGRLVIPVGPPSQQEVVVVSRHGDQFNESRREGCVFVPLIGAAGWPDA